MSDAVRAILAEALGQHLCEWFDYSGGWGCSCGQQEEHGAHTEHVASVICQLPGIAITER